MASRELQEEVLVQLLPSGALPCRQENVAAYVLVHNAAAGRHAAESHVDVFIKLNGYLQGVRGGEQLEGLVGWDVGAAPAQPHPWPRPHCGPPAGCPSSRSTGACC